MNDQITKKEIKPGDNVLLTVKVVNIKSNGDLDVEIIGDNSTKVVTVSGKSDTFKILNFPPNKITISPTSKERSE